MEQPCDGHGYTESACTASRCTWDNASTTCGPKIQQWDDDCYWNEATIGACNKAINTSSYLTIFFGVVLLFATRTVYNFGMTFPYEQVRSLLLLTGVFCALLMCWTVHGVGGYHLADNGGGMECSAHRQASCGSSDCTTCVHSAWACGACVCARFSALRMAATSLSERIPLVRSLLRESSSTWS